MTPTKPILWPHFQPIVTIQTTQGNTFKDMASYEQYSQMLIVSKQSLSIMNYPDYYMTMIREKTTNEFRETLGNNQMSGLSTFHIQLENNNEIILRWSNYKFSQHFIQSYKDDGYKVTEMWNG